MSIDPPISEIQHFQNLTLKIQGQGHNVGITPYPFRSMSIGHLRNTAISKFDVKNLR